MILIMSSVSALLYSCIDNDYDIDDLNKDALLKTPPIILGNIDTIWVETLPDDFPPISLPIEGEQISKSDIISGLFTHDILNKFFNEKTKEDVVLESKIDLRIMPESEDLRIEIFCEVLNAENSVLNNIKIKEQTLVNGLNQDFSITFPHEYFSDMQQASSLKFTFRLTAKTLVLSKKDFIYIKEVILKSGGMHFEF